MNVLVVDIGGSHVKMALAGSGRTTRFDSSPELTPEEAIKRIRAETDGWEFDSVSIGYPGRVGPEGPIEEPGNLGSGWVAFNFADAFGCPVRIVNDAVLQALGAYREGRMLFLGLGTGLGAALVTERVAVPLELGELPYDRSTCLMDRVGQDALERGGEDEWQQVILDVIPRLQRAFLADYVVLGGGNSARLSRLPPHTRRGGNEDAIHGGALLWREIIEPHDRDASPFWRVVE